MSDPETMLKLVAIAEAAKKVAASVGHDPKVRTPWGDKAVIVVQESFDAMESALAALDGEAVLEMDSLRAVLRELVERTEAYLFAEAPTRPASDAVLGALGRARHVLEGGR